MAKITQVQIVTEYITLGQFLKFASIIDQGWEAKEYLLTHDVLVDGVIEARRGRKLRGGERIETEGRVFEVIR